MRAVVNKLVSCLLFSLFVSCKSNGYRSPSSEDAPSMVIETESFNSTAPVTSNAAGNERALEALRDPLNWHNKFDNSSGFGPTNGSKIVTMNECAPWSFISEDKSPYQFYDLFLVPPSGKEQRIILCLQEPGPHKIIARSRERTSKHRDTVLHSFTVDLDLAIPLIKSPDLWTSKHGTFACTGLSNNQFPARAQCIGWKYLGQNSNFFDLEVWDDSDKKVSSGSTLTVCDIKSISYTLRAVEKFSKKSYLLSMISSSGKPSMGANCVDTSPSFPVVVVPPEASPPIQEKIYKVTFRYLYGETSIDQACRTLDPRDFTEKTVTYVVSSTVFKDLVSQDNCTVSLNSDYEAVCSTTDNCTTDVRYCTTNSAPGGFKQVSWDHKKCDVPKLR